MRIAPFERCAKTLSDKEKYDVFNLLNNYCK